jgi:hypothetical protein
VGTLFVLFNKFIMYVSNTFRRGGLCVNKFACIPFLLFVVIIGSYLIFDSEWSSGRNFRRHLNERDPYFGTSLYNPANHVNDEPPQKGLRYVDQSLFHPSYYGGAVIPFGEYVRYEHGMFNPSFTSIKGILYEKEILSVYPNTAYIGFQRHVADQCGRVVNPFYQKYYDRRMTLDAVSSKSSEISDDDIVQRTQRTNEKSSIVLLDKNFHFIDNIDASHHFQLEGGYDVRIHTTSKGEVICSYSSYPEGYSIWWQVYEVKFQVINDKITLIFEHPEYSSLKHAYHIVGGRNRPLMEKEIDGVPSMLILDGITTSDNIMVVDDIQNLRKYPQKHHVHFNGFVTYLESEQLYFTITHVHTDHIEKITKWGNTYMTYFVLFQKESPWRIMHSSKPWCFPSVEDPAQCEIIQFVMSAFIDENNKLHISYGVNDCDSAMAIIPMEDIIPLIKDSKEEEEDDDE